MTLEQLQDFLVNKGLFEFGETPTISQMAGITGHDIMTQFAQNYGLTDLIDEGVVDQSIFQSIPLDMLLQQQTRTYAPKKHGLERTAIQDMRQKHMLGGRKAYGGFAGSGQANLFRSGIKDEHGKSMAGILEEVVYKPKAQSAQALADWTSKWDEAMLNLSGNQ